MNVFHLVTLCIAYFLFSKCECTLTIRPLQTVLIAIPTHSAKFDCIGKSNEIKWFRKTYNEKDVEIKRSDMYHITANDQRSTLSITGNSSMTETFVDIMLFCESDGADSSTATLRVYNPTLSWLPNCKQQPKSLTSGDNVEMTCFSSTLDYIKEVPDLTWTKNGVVISNKPNGNATYTSVKYNKIVNRDDNGRQFVCEASLPNMQNPLSCSVTLHVDWSNSNIVPYIIVAVLSIIALILFAIVIVFAFRFRECKYCKETVPQPQQVLDMSSLREGVGVPIAVLSDQSSEDEVVSSSNSNKQTTSVNTETIMRAKTESKIKSTSSNHSRGHHKKDARLNFEDNFQKDESKGYETKTKDIVFNSTKETVDNDLEQYRCRSKSNRTKSERVPVSPVRQHPSTKVSSSTRPRSLQPRRTNERINNLGRNGRSTQPKADNNIKKTDDTVVYADLNFTRNPGLNIVKEEYS
ncbi:uncharacterized protein [Antedon mediterranea]|uniref:uncharacterized protein n=1 Tax=Antedon mediterranea TaxID=105859 RepID=UPI003AF58BBC